MLRKQTLEHKLDPADIRAVLEAGVSPAQIEDALAVSFVFNVMDRLADTFAFEVPPDPSFEIGARFLLARGYR